MKNIKNFLSFKNITICINIVLGIAILLLYYFHFSDNKDSPTLSTKSGENGVGHFPSSGETKGGLPSIVYINIDTLLNNYDFYNDLKDKLLKKQKNIENELNRKSAEFEKEAMVFQQKVQNNAFLSLESAQQQEQELIQKQQNLLQLKETLSMQLLEQEQGMNRQLHDSIIVFIKEFNKIFNYQFILSKTFGGGLIYANDSFDITDTIISGLNTKYRKIKLEKATD